MNQLVEFCTFGQALEQVKRGLRARRAVWPEVNFIFLRPGSIDAANQPPTEETFRMSSLLFVPGDTNTTTRWPSLCKRLVLDAEIFTKKNWRPLQADMLADDWVVMPSLTARAQIVDNAGIPQTLITKVP